ncbi:MAG TPA: histidinol dehydrogenase [Fimbriimonadaceae bacterium]|nr:histidinol dehydrogenase [Fimbriimonadaceae bacterium]
MSLCRWIDVREAGLEALQQEFDLRAPERTPEMIRSVAETIDDVQRRGALAAWDAARRFDAPDLPFDGLVVKPQELRNAQVEVGHHEAIAHAIARIFEFHRAQLSALTMGWERDYLRDGTANFRWQIPARQARDGATGFEGQRLIALETAGIYVPGGQANYASSVLMNCIPAIVAGVSAIQIACPARADGELSPAILVAARELGIRNIVKVGGAAAIALHAFGDVTGDLGKLGVHWSRADKVAGPGNRYVNEAKLQLFGRVGVDTYAGPSEVCVVADESADPAWAAADWLTQVEHSDDNVGIVVTWSERQAHAIVEAARSQLANAPRGEVMGRALRDRGMVILAANEVQAYDLVNRIAPEHLTLMVSRVEQALQAIRNAGCVMLGDFTPQSAGDFCSGPSHTLPTGGAARFGSPLSVMDFLKFQSVSRLRREDLRELMPIVRAFGAMEGFPQHARGAEIRFEDDGA